MDFPIPSGAPRGDGSESSPYNWWPDFEGASEDDPIDVLIAGHSAGALPASGLPPFVRIYGGYHRGERFMRRFPLVLVDLSSVKIGEADPALPPSARVIDGFRVRSSHSRPQIDVEGGPLLLSRNVFGQGGTANSVEIVSIDSSTNVALIGNVFDSSGVTVIGQDAPFVRLKNGAAPSLLFNDFYRDELAEVSELDPSSAILLDGEASGIFVGNRVWTGGAPSRVSFFKGGSLEAFGPSMIYGNAIVPGATVWSDGQSGVGWFAVEARAHGQPSGAAPNLTTVECGAWLPLGICRTGTGDGGKQLKELDGKVGLHLRNWLDLDWQGKRRPENEASIGASQVP